jgi:ParB family chromosome partitioning protein
MGKARVPEEGARAFWFSGGGLTGRRAPRSISEERSVVFMRVRTARIDDIKIADRIRKDYGDVEELARDIAENGLISPPVVTPDNVLIAGERRIRACRLLGWTEIPVVEMTVRDYEHQLRLEISENENRKEFTFSERMEYARRLEQVERLKARERQAHGQTAPGKTLVDNCPQALEETGRTRDKIAEAVGFGSGKTYERAKFIAEYADPETIRRLNAGEISVYRAYQETKAKLEAAERAAREAEARAEAERRKAEELAARLADAEKALAEAKAGSAEADRLRAQAEGLRRELEELKARGPEVVERVVEVPVEKEVVPQKVLNELKKLRAERDALLARVEELNRREEAVRQAAGGQARRMEEDAALFAGKVREFLSAVSCLAYTARELRYCRPEVRREYGAAVKALRDWAEDVLRRAGPEAETVDVEGVAL